MNANPLKALYMAFSTTHRQCSPAAKAAQTLLIHDAARLARMLERRYGR